MNATTSHTPPRAPVQGESATVNLAACRSHCALPSYLSFVRLLVRKGEGSVYVAQVFPAHPDIPGSRATAFIRAWRGDLLGDAHVPLSALTFTPDT